MILMCQPGAHLRVGRELARGGEGKVCEMPDHPESVIKLYDTPLNSKRAAKLRAMVNLRVSHLLDAAWPSDLVEDQGKVIGLIMPRINGRHDLHEILSSSSRRKIFPDADYRTLVATAANLARAVAGVHAAGFVIGDVNERFAMVGADATVRLVDCDSYQIEVGGTLFGCDVGTLMYQPPELQGERTFRHLARRRNHDAFGLAVLIFQLLFFGRHPFAGRPTSGDAPELPEAIRTLQFAWGGRLGLQQPPNTLSLAHVGTLIETYFRRAFGSEGESEGRPKAAAWAMRLEELRDSLIRCKANRSHWHLHGTCPICAIESATNASFFAVGGNLSGALYNPERETQALWTAIMAIAEPSVPQAIHSLGIYSSGVIAVPYPPRPTRGWAGSLLQSIGLLGARDDEERERRLARRDTACKAFEHLRVIYNSYDSTNAFNRQKAGLNRTRVELQDFFKQRSAAIQALQNRLGLHRFLESFGLSRAGLKGFGPTLLSTLIAHGVGSAADVSPANLSSIPGVGPKRKEVLYAWRKNLEQFHKPAEEKTTLNVAQVQQIDMHHETQIEVRITTLRSGAALLRTLIDQEKARATLTLDELRLAARAAAQAEADLQAPAVS